MAGLSFDDLTTQKQTKAVSFDDLARPVVKKQIDKQGIARTVFDQGAQGATFGFADEAIDSVGRSLAEAYVRLSPYLDMKDLPSFKETRDISKDRLSQQFEQRPVLSIGSNILGGVATSGPAAFTKTGAALGNVLRSGGTAARIGKGALAGAATGAVYGAGTAQDGQRMQGAGSGALTGAVIGGAIPATGALLGSVVGGSKNIYKGITARGEQGINETLDVIKQGSRNLYSYADDSGVLAKPEAAQDLIQGLSGIVKNKDIASQKLYSSTLGAIKDLSDDIAAGNTGLMTLDRHRQILGNISKDITNPNKAQEAEAAGRAMGVIDDFIDGLSPEKLTSGTPDAINALKSARAEWSKSKRFEKIGDIIINAKNDANKLKRDLNSFRANPKNTFGWSGAERKALDFAADQTTGEGLIKMAGKFGFDLGSGRSIGNTALPVLGGVGAGAASGAVLPAGAVIAAGTAARAAQKGLALGKAEELLRVIEKGGNITREAIDALPQSEKKNFLSRIMQLPVAQARRILSNSNQDVTK